MQHSPEKEEPLVCLLEFIVSIMGNVTGSPDSDFTTFRGAGETLSCSFKVPFFLWMIFSTVPHIPPAVLYCNCCLPYVGKWDSRF